MASSLRVRFPTQEFCGIQTIARVQGETEQSLVNERKKKKKKNICIYINTWKKHPKNLNVKNPMLGLILNC